MRLLKKEMAKKVGKIDWAVNKQNFKCISKILFLFIYLCATAGKLENGFCISGVSKYWDHQNDLGIPIGLKVFFWGFKKRAYFIFLNNFSEIFKSSSLAFLSVIIIFLSLFSCTYFGETGDIYKVNNMCL